MENLESRTEQLISELMVLQDLLRRSQWYLGTDKQSSPPTLEEMKEFLQEIKEVLK